MCIPPIGHDSPAQAGHFYYITIICILQITLRYKNKKREGVPSLGETGDVLARRTTIYDEWRCVMQDAGRSRLLRSLPLTIDVGTRVAALG
jgi:hypothetical protein